MAAQFDASQYGFFGGAPVAEEGGVLLSELEGESGSGALEGSGDAGDQPARPRWVLRWLGWRRLGSECMGAAQRIAHAEAGKLPPSICACPLCADACQTPHPSPHHLLPPCCRSDPGTGAGEGSGDRYQLWGGALLPDELDSKLNLGPAEPGRGSAPPSAPPSVTAGSPPAGAAGTAGAQPTADIASLWGNAQVGLEARIAAVVPTRCTERVQQM